jgi:hypothetical protein
MKKKYALYAILIGIILIDTGLYCDFNRRFEFEEYQPVYMNREALNQSVKSVAPRALSNPGKIYVYGNFLYINERYKGVHIINNTNPAQPINVGFIEVPGNLDIAVKNSIMYVDNAVDLVTIDVSKPTDIQVLNRQENVFPIIKAPDGRNAFSYNYNPSMGYIVNWTLKNR